ncbi:MAG: redoxin domain-containing protein [Thermomicrobiales bacterium]
MDTLLLLARLVLAAVFVVAGVAKLADLSGSKKALEGFGLPARLAMPGSILLPLVEIVVGVLLLPRDTARWAAIGALALLLVFVAAIGYNLARGRTPDCHCFGQLHSEPAGWSTLLRNGVLAAVAGLLIAGGWGDPGPSTVAWIGDLSTSERVLGAVAALALVGLIAEGWLVVHLLSQNGRVLLRLDAIETMIADGGAVAAADPAAAPAAPRVGLPEGAPAPAFRLEGLHGETMTLDALRAAGKQVLLIFSDPNCGPCNALLPDLGRWQREHASKLTLALLSRGKPEANKAKAAEHGLSHVLLQEDREVAQLYQAHGTPSAVLVHANGTIASPVSSGAEAIRTLVSTVTGTLSIQPAAVPARSAGNGAAQAPSGPAAAPRPAANYDGQAAPDPRIGQPAPAISLPDLEGKTVNLADFKGDPTLLVFWNPGCGFCRRMVDDLKAWEVNPPKGAPKLLLVSTGEVEANTSLGLASPTVLDQGFAIGRAYGASGTPSALLVDKDGKIASGVAVGSPGVLALANGQDPKTVAVESGAPAPPASKKGQKAPAVKLPDLDGNIFELSKLRGGKTLLVFWNPGCGFCRRMIDDLRAWEADPPKGAPKVVYVSTGTVEANREQGLSSTILLDDGFAVGRNFGASGTPSAVLIDAKGNIASDVAVGAPGVLALAGVQQNQAQAV